MKKITLLILTLFLSYSGFAQFPTPGIEGFEGTAGADLAAPTTPSPWSLGTGATGNQWAVFDNGVGLNQRWSINNGTVTPPTPPLVYAGVNAAYMNRENIGINNTSEDYLATPLITVPANGQLRFFTRSFTLGNQGTIYQVKVNTVAGTQTTAANYTTLLAEYTEDQLTLNPQGVQQDYNIYTEKIIDFPAALIGQQVYVAFVMKFTQLTTGIGGDRWLLDDVRVDEKCLNPTALTATGLLFNQATLSWGNPSGATSWEIEIIGSTATPTGVGVVYNGTLPYIATGLTANTCYKYYVRAACSSGLNSDWVGPFNFCTTTAPPICGGNFVDPGGPTANYANSANVTTVICPTNATDLVTITFTAFALENNFDFLRIYDGSDTTAPQLANLTGNALPPSFTSSTPGGCLTFVFTSDTSVTAAGWIANVTCAPAPSCTKPIGLTAITSSTTATLTWNQLANPDGSVPSSWQVIALPCGSPAPTAATTGWTDAPTNPFVLTGLNPITCYNFYVRAVCSASDSSAWSTVATATTQVVPPVCGGTYTDPAGPTTNYANNTDSIVTICPITPGDAVTVTFTAFNTQATADGLYVFNGNSIAATQIASANPAGTVPGGLAGSFWGTAIPGPFTSSSPDGCLTFRFRSGAATVAAGWVANVTCAPAPTCAAPINVTSSALLSTSVNLAWNGNSSATTWHVLALPCGSPAPTPASTGWVSTTNNPFLLTGLNPDTCYNIYVRGECSPTDISPWSTPITLTTLVAPPVCGGTFTDPGGSAGNYANSANVTTVICPTNATDLVTVTFTAFALENNFDFLRIYNGNSAAAPLLATLTGAALPPSFTSTIPGGCLTFVFTSDTSVVQAGWIANVTCAPAPTCTKPTGVIASAVLSTTANVTWTQPLNPDGSTASAWEIIALPCGSPIPTAATPGWIAAPTNPFALTGLNPDTCYTIYVRAICSPTDASTPSNGINITTQQVPPACGGTFSDPGGVSANYANNLNVTTTICPSTPGDQVTVTFTSFATENGLDILRIYDGNSAAGVLLGTYSGNALPPQWTGSTSNGCLTFVFTTDGSVVGAGWVANVTCAPAPTCPKPTNLVATAINSTSSTLTWTENGTATSWEVIVQPAGAGMPAATATGVIVSTPSYIANGLTAGVNYEFWVRALCSESDISIWGGPRTFFVTTTCNDSQPFCGETGTVYSNTVGNPSLGQIGCLFTTPNPAWFYFEVLNSGPLNFQIAQTTAGGAGIDVDFIAYGPFANLQAACGVLAPTVACSYSIAPIENFSIPSAIAGQIYVVMITNFSNQPGTVTFNQTNNGAAGAGSTDCEIVCSVDLGEDQVICNATSYTITATTQGATSYTWYLDNVLIPTATSQTLVATVSGNYKCVIVCGLNTEEDIVNITFNTPTTPTFDPIANICQNGSATALPLTSTNGITGTWNPVTIDTSVAGTSTYTFTPSVGECATVVTIDVTIDAPILPVFDPIADICQGATAVALPLTSTNGITGTWNPASTDTSVSGTFTFTFTPDSTPTQSCVSTTTLSVVVSGQITPTFASIANVCQNTNGPTLPLTSLNGITGTWNPSVIDSSVVGTATYTFTPDATPSQSCAISTTLNVTIDQPVTPTFDPVANICIGGASVTLPTTSTNGVNGTWNVASVDTSVSGTSTYTFTPNAGICAIAVTLDVTIDALTVPTFDAIPNICLDLPTVALPGTSTNGITGTWSPATIDTSVIGTVTYTFTPDAGQCADVATLNVTIDAPSIVPTFNAIPNICLDLPTVTLPGTSTNGITGTWSPATIDTSVVGTVTYTFTPDAAQCAVTATLDVTIDAPSIVPTFNAIPNICLDLPTVTLSGTSTNGITGTWSPATIDTSVVGTVTYTFTPDAAQCAVATTLNVTIDAPSIVPTFNAIPTICINDVAPTLPTTSLNGITGTWSPSTIDTSVIGTSAYTFTPNAAQCAVVTTLNVTIAAPITASFTQIAAICQGGTAPALPTTSNNGVAGIWNPATINTSVAGTVTYTFTPNAGQCATGTTMTVVIHPTPVVAPLTPVVSCVSYTLPNLTSGNYYTGTGGTGTQLAGGTVITSSQTIYVFEQSGTTPNCTAEQELDITINPAPQFSVTGGCVGPIYVLEVVSDSFDLSSASYVWTNSAGQPVGTNSSTLNVTTAGNYTCQVTANGCTDSYLFSANSITCLVPKGISPNGDGQNDNFDLTGFNVRQLNIYNRYGSKVYSRANYTNQWFGQSDKDEELPDGTYYYVIERNDSSETKTGWIYINRENK